MTNFGTFIIDVTKFFPGSLGIIKHIIPIGFQYVRPNLVRRPTATTDNSRHLKLGDTHPHTLESWNNLIDFYETWNKPEKAEEWRVRLAQIEVVEE